MARLLGDASNRPWTPPVDIVETENELILKADVPEVNLKDIDISLENGTLTFKGERKFEKQDKAAGYHRMSAPTARSPAPSHSPRPWIPRRSRPATKMAS